MSLPSASSFFAFASTSKAVSVPSRSMRAAKCIEPPFGREDTHRAADCRSDTVTKPTPEMRKAMAEAEVGDDVYGEDPTVARLQEETAALFGREAALFVPTGCMGNQIAVRLQTHPGEEVAVEAVSHT